MFLAQYRFTESGARQRAAERGLSFPAPKTPRIAPSAPTAVPVANNVVPFAVTRFEEHRRVIDLVARMHGASYAIVVGPRKLPWMITARQAALCAVNEYELQHGRRITLARLGRMFGYSDHATVHYSFAKRGYAQK